MPRFQVTDHKRARDAPPEPPGTSPPTPRRPDRRKALLSSVTVAFVRLSLLMIGVALLVSGVSGMGSEIGYGTFRPVSDTEEVTFIVDPAYKSEFYVDVTQDPQGRDLVVRFSDNNTHAFVVVPTMGGGEPRYGMKLAVARLDPELQPLVMYAPPEKSARTVTPTKDNGVRQDFEVFEFTTTGRYRFVFSADERGEVRALMTVSGAGTLGSIVRGEFDWVQIVAGVLLVALAAASAFPLPRRTTSQDEPDRSPVERDLLEHDETRILDGADGNYARVGFARSSLTSEENGPETPDRLARAKGKGWVIRLD